MSNERLALFLVVLHVIDEEISSVNVALGKSGSLCDIKFLNDEYFDGEKYPSYLETDLRGCQPHTFISVKLESLYFIHFVIIDAGVSAKTNPAWDFFKVFTLNNHSCGQFEKCYSSVNRGSGMRVNCLMSVKPTSEVEVRLIRRNTSFSIAEIAIHTLASGTPNEPTLFYKGCFKQFLNLEVRKVDNFTECWRWCQYKKYGLMGIQGDKCHCGKDYSAEDEMDESECLFKCASNEPCGGDDTFSLYVVNTQLPYYYGCGLLPEAEHMLDGNITISKCVQICDRARYVWLRENACGCMDELPVMVSAPFCHSKCSGNPRDICGDQKHVTIYGTCLTSRLLPCSKLFQCVDSFDKYGRCLNGCKAGFDGSYCILRVLSRTTDTAIRGMTKPIAVNVVVVVLLTVLLLVSFQLLYFAKIKL